MTRLLENLQLRIRDAISDLLTTRHGSHFIVSANDDECRCLSDVKSVVLNRSPTKKGEGRGIFLP